MSIAGLPMAGPLIVCACGGFLPTLPYTTRAVESGWGDPVDGLSILVATDASSVTLGGEIPVEVFFRYSPFLAGRNGVTLLRDYRTERWTLVLRDAATGRVWERPPYDVGMPMWPDPDPTPPLVYGPAGERSDLYILLSDDGEQVPAGTYDATIRYTNDGSPGEREVQNPAKVQDEDPARPLWRGTIETGPLRLRVLPRDADTTRCEIPTAVTLEWNDMQGRLTWKWAPDSWESVVLVSQPGYHLGCSTRCDWFVDNDPFPDPPPDASREEQDEFFQVWGLRSYGSLGGSLPSRGHPPGGGGGWAGGARFHEVVERGEPFRVVVHVKLFETSVPGGHLWMPERGDYRVLREREAVGEWP